MKKINKILIANRGEIALRIIRACNERVFGYAKPMSATLLRAMWYKPTSIKRLFSPSPKKQDAMRFIQGMDF